MNAVYKNNRKIIGLSYLNQVDPTTLYIFFDYTFGIRYKNTTPLGKEIIIAIIGHRIIRHKGSLAQIGKNRKARCSGIEPIK